MACVFLLRIKSSPYDPLFIRSSVGINGYFERRCIVERKKSVPSRWDLHSLDFVNMVNFAANLHGSCGYSSFSHTFKNYQNEKRVFYIERENMFRLELR